MTITISSSLWLAVMAVVTEIHGDTWPPLLADVGNYPDSQSDSLALDLYNGANVDTIGPNGWTALHIAAGLDKPIMVTILTEGNSANPDIQDSFSYTPLHVATGLNHLAVINALVPVANTEIKGPSQWTALHMAAANGFTDAVLTLISTGANVNAVDSNGWTPLHLAIGQNQLPAVTAILAAPATNLNLQDNKGYTPLHIAAGNNRPDMVSALLAKGALANILDNNGQTAKQVAAYLGYSNIVALIP